MRPTRNALLAALEPASRVLLEAAEDAARALDVGLWLVGGGVRDLAVRRPLHDVDLAFAGDPSAFVDAVAARCPEVTVERTDRFGTATIASDEARLDLARLRTERYVVPGALPEVRAAKSIEADLARRDFSVNAIALELAPEVDRLIDPYGGIEDLGAGRLRVLHERSFIDDATRLWRGARTAALFDLEPDAATARLIDEGLRWTEEISGTRLWAELAYTAGRGRALGTLERLERWGVLRSVHPGFCLAPESAAALQRRHPMPVERFAAVLLAPLAARDAILERFQAPGAAREVVQETARLLAAESKPDSLLGVEGVSTEARLAARWLQPEQQAELQRALRRWERTRPWLNAEQLVAMGVPRGPALGAALRGLRRGRYLGTLRTIAEARRHVRRVLASEAHWDFDEPLD
ncbi:MAG: CCA tRNA nucleotidyltransferase [Dehalococcoidia bacterium]|nr:CCA tRNA nucleotidyltransferase [Dehalococcoidia bacterium]